MEGSGTDTRIWWATYNDSTQTWSAQEQIPGVGTSYAPSVSNSPTGSQDLNTYVVAWKGDLADEKIWYVLGERPVKPGPPPPPLNHDYGELGQISSIAVPTFFVSLWELGFRLSTFVQATRQRCRSSWCAVILPYS